MSTSAAEAVTGREAIEHLGKIKFFSGLPAAYLRRIADIGAEETYVGGSTIFSEGDKGDKFYLAYQGGTFPSPLARQSRASLPPPRATRAS